MMLELYEMHVFESVFISARGLQFSTYAPVGGGGGQASYTFPLCITCKKGVGGSR